MADIKIVAICTIGLSILAMGLCVPLILRKIPMNSLYGIRFSPAFKSDRNWYDINTRCGKVAIRWFIPILLFGLVGLTLPPEDASWYTVAAPLFGFGLSLTWALHCYLIAKAIEKKNRQ